MQCTPTEFLLPLAQRRFSRSPMGNSPLELLELLWTTEVTRFKNFGDRHICNRFSSEIPQFFSATTTPTTSEHLLRARHCISQSSPSHKSHSLTHKHDYYREQKPLKPFPNSAFCYPLYSPFYTGNFSIFRYFSVFSLKRKSFVCFFHFFLLFLLLGQHIPPSNCGGGLSAGIEKKTVAKIGK